MGPIIAGVVFVGCIVYLIKMAYDDFNRDCSYKEPTWFIRFKPENVSNEELVDLIGLVLCMSSSRVRYDRNPPVDATWRKMIESDHPLAKHFEIVNIEEEK
jgi:hypothetical protein